MIRIRQAEGEDMAEVEKLVRAAMKFFFDANHSKKTSQIAEIMAENIIISFLGQLIFVVVDGDKVMGTVGFSIDDKKILKISPLISRSGRQSHSVSRMLIKKVKEYAEIYETKQLCNTIVIDGE